MRKLTPTATITLPAVLHPDVVDFLRSGFEKSLTDAVWNCLQKLKIQQFDGGLRVKKLKGITKRVWEARINKSCRLIFTYEKSRRPETGVAQVYIAVQDICIEHDDVSRRARARKRTSNAFWLDAELVEAIGSLECSRTALDPDEQFALYYAQTESSEVEEQAPWWDELLGNTQWRVLESAQEWQQALTTDDVDLSLRLTPDEYELVYLPGNLLLEGTAGTGKTTVALYRLLRSLENLSTGKRLYVACSPLLVKTSLEQFKRLVGETPEINFLFQFKTLRDLCRDYLSSSGHDYELEDEVNFQGFCEMYRRHTDSKRFPAALVWSEIRSIIKGSNLETLSEADYVNLTRRCPTVIPATSRPVVYKIAQWYQKKLLKSGRFDEVDLTQKLLDLLSSHPHERYQLIVCDEVQDLTGLQLELLLQLLAPDGYFFIAGDVNQMINPGGFRWEDLKQKFYTRHSVEEKTLNFNFRSVGTLVNLGNQILKLRSRLLNAPFGKNSMPAGSFGECARVVAAPPETLQLHLGQLNPGDAILVKTDADKHRFSQDFKSSLVFTVEESKGLEFDTVFLVDFFKPRQGLWSKVFRSSFLESIEKTELKLELNLLYIAITRARRLLNIWEDNPSELWRQQEVVGYVKSVEVEVVVSEREEFGSASWRERGHYYFKAELYRQAAECFDKSGDTQLHFEAYAKLLLQERQYGEAALVYIKLQKWSQAARLFEKVHRWEQAADCWEQAGNSEQQHLCKIYLLESAGQWALAAQQWALRGQFERAAKHFSLVKQWQQAADCWFEVGNTKEQHICEIYLLESAGQWSTAAQRWSALRQYANAKRCWFNSDNELKKAEYRAKDFEKIKNWSSAAIEYELAGLTTQAAKCRAFLVGEESPVRPSRTRKKKLSTTMD